MRTMAVGDIAQPVGTLNDFTDRVKVEVANASDVLVNLSQFGVSLEYDVSADESVAGALIVFRRLDGASSLAPLMTASPPVELGRRIVVSINPGSGTYTEVFRGRIVDVDWPERYGDVTCRCLDQAGVLARAWIRTGRPYGTTTGMPLEVVMQQVANDNLISPPTIFFPTVTSAVVQHLPGDDPYGPVDQSVLEALRTLAESIGGTIRYRHWGASASDWHLSFFFPSRTKTIPDYSFSSSDYWDVTTIQQSDEDIRNMVEVQYVGPDGQLASVTVQDAASIAKYNNGEPLYMRIVEGSGSPINNATLATALANAALSDLKEPDAILEITGRYFWPGEIGVDLYNWAGNGIHFSTSQTLAPMRFTHRIAVGERPTTKILARGKPSGGLLMWRRRGSIGTEIVTSTSPAITRISFTESTDGTLRNFSVNVNDYTDSVHVYYRIVPVDAVGEPTDFSGSEDVSLPTPTILVLRPAVGKVTFSLPHPASGFKVAARFVPFTTPESGLIAGESWPVIVDPAPPLYTEARAVVTAATPTQITVTVSGASLGGTPTVGLVGVTGSAALASGHAAGVYTWPVNGVDNVWVFNRGAFGGGSGQAQFRVISSGAESDDDFVEIPEIGRDTVYMVMRARVVSVTATTIVARVAIADPYPQGTNSATIAWSETNVGAGTTPATGQTVTPAATLTEAAGTFVDFTITRPAFGTGAGRVTFTVTAANRISDSDAIDIPEVDRDTIALAIRARITASTATTATVRVAVADPYPQGASTGTISYVETGGTGAAASPASGGFVTPASSITEAAGTFIDYTVTRPAWGTGTRRITFTATAANRTSESDAVDVPAVERDTVDLVCRAKVQSTAATQVVFRVAVADYVSGGSGDVTLTYTAVGCTVSTPSSPQTILAANVTADIDTTGTVDVTVNRGAYTAGMGRITFTATRTGRVPATDSGDVPSIEQNNPGSLVLDTNGSNVVGNFAGPDTCNSWRYAVSSSSMPSDGSADVGTVLNSRVGVVTFSGAVPNLGDRYYVKARQFSGASGGGTGGPYITAEVERQNKSTTKTLRIGASQFTPQSNLVTDWLVAAWNARPNVKANSQAFTTLVLPLGSVITEMRLTGTRSAVGVVVTAALEKYVGSSGTLLVNIALTGTAGQVTVAGSLSETVDSSIYSVSARVDTTAGASATDGSWMFIEIDYTAGSLDTTI